MAQSDTDRIISVASPKGATIESLPGLLTIFGGSLSSEQEIDDAITPPKSNRDACVQWLRANRKDMHDMLLLPENYDDWSSFNTYSDLLRFEEDLAYLTDAVVIFLEAPGSIAELGAFSQIPSLRDRLVIVVTDDRHPKKSFISLGPLRQLEALDKLSICAIPVGNTRELANHINVVIGAVNHKISKVKPKRSFDPTEKQHQFALALDVIGLAEVLTFTDIKLLFEHFQINENETRIRQILFTLEKSKLIKKRRYGGIDYYGPSKRGLKHLDYKGLQPDEKFNRSRVQSRILMGRDQTDARSKVHQLFFPKEVLP
jgi:flavodoxin